MLTFTYYVQGFYKSDDPRPKFLAGESLCDLKKLLNDSHIHNNKSVILKEDYLWIVTVSDEIKKHYLNNTDYCTICNDWYGKKCFCGQPIISIQHLTIDE